MLTLDLTTKSLTCVLGGTNSHEFVVDFLELPGGARLQDGIPKSQVTAVAVTAETTILTAPAAGFTRVVTRLSCRNATANSTTVAVGLKVTSDATYKVGSTVTLADGQSFVLGRNTGAAIVYNKTGEAKAAA